MNAPAWMAALLATCAFGAWAQSTPRFDGERKHSPIVLPPYRLSISPAVQADENQAIVVQPVPGTSAAAASERSCTISFRPDSGAGSSWQGLPDAGCARQDTLRLPVGAYWVRLTMRWKALDEAVMREDSHDLPYKVRAGDRLRLQAVRVEPAQPQPMTPAKLAWELQNTGPVPLQPVVVEIQRDGQAVDRRTRSALAPGETWRDGFAFTAGEGQRVSLALIADPDGRSGEPDAHRTNNRAERVVDMQAAPPPTPLLVLGEVTPNTPLPGVRAATWSRLMTICNVDPTARYVSEFRGPGCMPLPCTGPYSGTPARGDFRPGSFAADGTTMSAPACPTGLPFAGGLKPGILQGPIGHTREHGFDLTVFAEKNGRRSPSASVSFTVAPNCRPPCVETESGR